MITIHVYTPRTDTRRIVKNTMHYIVPLRLVVVVKNINRITVASQNRPFTIRIAGVYNILNSADRIQYRIMLYVRTQRAVECDIIMWFLRVSRR